MEKLVFDYSNMLIKQYEIDNLAGQIKTAHDMLHKKTGAGNDFLGWVDHPNTYDKEEFERVIKAAEKIKKDSQVLLVIGIGGSYLGARAAIEMLGNSFYNNMSYEDRKTPEIYFVGNSISGTYFKHLMNIIKGKDISLCIISKSGTTTEPAIAFRFLKTYLEEKYGKQEAAKRIYAVTDVARGALKQLANAEGYESFVIADDVGGRYSVLTPVGLLPIAVAGLDIRKIMQGAIDATEEYKTTDLNENPCYQYAAARNIMHETK